MEDSETRNNGKYSQKEVGGWFHTIEMQATFLPNIYLEMYVINCVAHVSLKAVDLPAKDLVFFKSHAD